MNTESQKSKLNFLDGVRGVAMLIVVLHHFGIGFFPAINYLNPEKIHLGDGSIELMIAKSPLSIFFNGGFAVSIFFVLSGFVLSYKFHLTGNRKLLTDYAAKRYFRLFIPVAGSIIICYVLHLCGLFTNHHPETIEITKSQDWLGGLFSNMKGPGDVLKNMFVDVFLNNDNRYNPVLWTMTIEFLGSLLVFSFLALTANTKKTILLHIIVAVLILLTDRKFYAAFILGSLISKLFIDGFSFPKGLKGASIKWILLAAGIYFSSFPQSLFTDQSIWKPLNWSWTNGYDLFHVVGAFCILFVICFDKTLTRIFSIKPFLYLGKISFSFYLLHLAVMCTLGCFIFQQLWKPGTYFIPFLVSFLICMVVSFICAHFYYKWVDKSSIRFSEKMGKWIAKGNDSK
ncbi:acyltransferase family protein [Fluviicola taffensis]|uniref:Acyltransferase 3 n=1 Tax=Fluviicola taffensis (strain DSM 16823 / NCIMB 13979 / RW262) TaxID=755732 RepID=F2IDN5_FLUTR|nr:acyltransferase [Fluviicola taffensis]AEA43408.1 acyltransferase 3 [Fluviicola taffensis DSM 16823]